jgi:hypothetical protein
VKTTTGITRIGPEMEATISSGRGSTPWMIVIHDTNDQAVTDENWPLSRRLAIPKDIQH